MATAAENALCQLTEMPNWAKDFEIEVRSLKSQMDKVVKIRKDATSSANERGWEAKTFKPCISLLKDELGYLKRKKLTGCEMEIMGCKVVDAEGKANDLADGMCQDTFDLYASIRPNID